MKNISSKRAKALAISKKTKEKVFERDNHKCVLCGSPYGLPEAHYIRRSRGGLGIEQNIVTLCRICHTMYDFGTIVERDIIRQRLREYLKGCYPDWSESDLYYEKYKY